MVGKGYEGWITSAFCGLAALACRSETSYFLGGGRQLAANPPAVLRPTRNFQPSTMAKSSGSKSVVQAAKEFIVILVSILAAFALDAWWDNSVAERRTQNELESVKVELTQTVTDLNELDLRLQSLRSAVVTILNNIGPEATPLGVDSLSTLMDLSFRLNKIEVQTGSIQSLLSSGSFSSIQEPDLKIALASYPAKVARIRNESELLLENREFIVKYLNDKMPTLAITQKTGQMDAYPTTRFSVSTTSIQRDITFEGLFSSRGMGVEDTLEEVLILKEETERVLQLINNH